MDDLLQEFIAETRETLEALSGEIVAWEANPTDGTRLAAIFRFVHTVKGSCGFLDLPRLARLSHAAEDALGAVRSGDRQPDRAFVNAVLAVVDRIGALVEAIDAGTSIDGNGEDVLIAALAEGSAEVAQTVTVAQRAPSRSVRLNVELLDRMMSGMSDMVLARNELARRLRDENPDPALEAALERMSATVADMRDTVTRTRMQKIDALFSALPRLVRDTAAGLGKSVTLCMEGADVELDREMIEMLRDPLVHIIRNSIDHGIETPTARRAAGKRENGRLTVSARQSGNQIIVEITDDGAGIDTGRLIGKMVAAGRSEAELRAMSEQALLDLIFTPGVSTKDEVSDISGRGVGMDVVRTAIEAIGGRIELHSTRWRGLRLAIHVPLTLSIIPTIIVGVGAQQFAVPRQAIEEIVGEHGDAVHIDRVGTSRLATLRERRLPLVELAERFAIPGTDDGAERMLVIVGAGVGSYAMMVDSVIDSEELVIKPAAPAIMASGLFAGQTLPDSGRPMLMLDCAGIAADAGLHFEREVAEDVDAAAADHAETRVLLFRDLDDVTRAVPLVAVDRVESVARTAIARSGGALRLTLDGQIIPLIASGDLADREQVAIMRLEDGASGIAYAIVEPLDIVSISDALVPPREPGAFAGVALVDGEQVEVLDLHWLFARHADRRAVAGDGPLCRIDDDPWLGNFVRPLLEQAGYRVTTRTDAGVAPDVVIGFGKDGVRLHRDGDGADATDGSVWRYDREAILAAVSARAGRRGGR